EQWLIEQRRLYEDHLPEVSVGISTHPISGEWRESNYLQQQFLWGGGASRETWLQMETHLAGRTDLTCVAAFTFGPVQTFLGAGQRLRDWAVASWLCHYLAAVMLFRWQERGGVVLLPRYRGVELWEWLQDSSFVGSERFWRAELPNVMTGLHPGGVEWLREFEGVIAQEWERLIMALEQVVVKRYPQFLDGIGWRVIHRDHRQLWTVYGESEVLEMEGLSRQIARLHRRIEERKLARQWRYPWWGGRTSPSMGSHSIWHPGLKPLDQGGTWGIPDEQLDTWWERVASKSGLAGLFSKDERLNSLEIVKRLASTPELIEDTLAELWGKTPPPCPWGRFPDQTATAAAWITQVVEPGAWNEKVEIFNELIFGRQPLTAWGIPGVDRAGLRYAHPRVLERRNVRDWEPELLEEWDREKLAGWECVIEWTVGWRGDGDQMGQWLSGEQYQKRNLAWSRWHLDEAKIEQFGLGIPAPKVPPVPRRIELPHMLDLSVLFGYWNELLYALVEEHHLGKVIFAGGDDFLLLGPITEAVSLTGDLLKLWRGMPNPVTQPLEPACDGWVQREGKVYPVPGEKMDFSLGVVIAQRRIPQSLWHRNLNQAYKQAKNSGRNRVCVRVLFNSGQRLEWVCPWPLWVLLMEKVQPRRDANQTELNRWEKLLAYVESTRLSSQAQTVLGVESLLRTLWASVGIDPGLWDEVLGYQRQFQKELESWDWWLSWISMRGFLARQERERQRWIERVGGRHA
ncbi:MAG: hypothetical protein NZ821_08055, partial [Gloeomargarita sp. SKYB31]|nr:hypothetical protein [Gloeomargarita sp. SKYB31]